MRPVVFPGMAQNQTLLMSPLLFNLKKKKKIIFSTTCPLRSIDSPFGAGRLWGVQFPTAISLPRENLSPLETLETIIGTAVSQI
jgi:hypothetical protein